MRILHIGKFYYPSPGGIESYCKNICEEVVRRGIETDIIVANSCNKFKEEVINGINVYRMPKVATINSIAICPKMIHFTKNIIRRRLYDVIHLHFPNPMGEISYLFSSYKGKLVLTYHADASMRNKLKLIYFPVINLLFKKVNYIIVTSDNYLKSRLFLKRYINRCRTIPIPVNPFFLGHSDSNRVSQIKNIYGEFILFVGNLASYKGQDYLIRAIKEVSCNLVMIGIGHNEYLDRLVKNMMLEKRVFFLGRVEDVDLINFYDACKVFCLPSISDMETFGVVLLEAMARGKPVVSTELGTGTSWVNVDGETGLVVKPRSIKDLADAIDILMKDENICQRMGENARKRILEYFTIPKIVDFIIEIYKN